MLFYLSHLFRRDLTPAEAVDYYACEKYSYKPDQWAAFRDVSGEAVRKNVRQAKAKLADDETKYWDSLKDIRAVDKEMADLEATDG